MSAVMSSPFFIKGTASRFDVGKLIMENGKKVKFKMQLFTRLQIARGIV